MTLVEGARQAAYAFDLPGRVTRVERHDEGLIHDTFIVTSDAGHDRSSRFILQRINQRVFADPAALMRNIELVVSFLEERAAQSGRDPHRDVVSLVRTRDGASWLKSDGDAWRMLRYVEKTRIVHQADNARIARQIGRAFGRFLSDLSDLNPVRLATALPGYRDTARYLDWLKGAAEEDRLGRAEHARSEIEFIESRTDDALYLQALQRGGSVRLRTIHGDTKLTNVLLDADTGKAVCVIDLDTVMPGLFLHDVGDCIREALVRTDVPSNGFTPTELRLVGEIVGGFLAELAPRPTERETANVIAALRSITLELGARFLADYLSGDAYFKTNRPGENLDRSIRHFRLFQEIERHRSDLEAIVGACAYAESADSSGGA